MIRKLLPFTLFALVIAACGKDQFNTKPTLKVINQSRVVPFDSEAFFSITLEYTDKEGDVAGVRDSSLFYQPVFLNVRSLLGGSNYPLIYSSLPEFPEKNKGEIEIRMIQGFVYRPIQNNQGGTDANDTIVLKIALKDKAGNVSDTVTTEPIILLGQ